MAKEDRDKVIKIYERERIRDLRKELKRSRRSGSGACSKVCGERDESEPQLHAGLQLRVRGGSDKERRDRSELNSPTEMAGTDSWTSGEAWTSEEESFKGTREEVISWIKSYTRDS